MLRSLIVDGVFAGVGAVIVFLPQILILFLFILVLEATGYMVRAAFLMDRLMSHAGLSGRAFIPLLSSFACAVPGIMATRTIDDPKDRLTTILVAPLMTCSARLAGLYADHRRLHSRRATSGPASACRGWSCSASTLSGIVGALLAALVLRRTVVKGGGGAFMMELPKYQLPRLADVAHRPVAAGDDLPEARRHDHPRHHDHPVGAGQLPPGRAGPKAVRRVDRRPYRRRHPCRRRADRLQQGHQPGAAAGDGGARGRGGGDRHRLFARRRPDEQGVQTLAAAAAGRWSLATALAFLAWFVFAPQCISTIAVTRRETNGWKWPLFMVGYLFVLAYIAAGATYWTAVAFGLG